MARNRAQGLLKNSSGQKTAAFVRFFAVYYLFSKEKFMNYCFWRSGLAEMLALKLRPLRIPLWPKQKSPTKKLMRLLI